MAERNRSSGLPTGVVAGAVFVLAVVGLLVLFFTLEDSDPRATLGEYEPGAVEAAVEAALEPVTLRPSRSLRVTGRRIRWLDPTGEAFLVAPRVTMTVLLGAAPDGGVLLSEGVIQEPTLRLVQTGEESWNYERPLAPFLGDDPGGDDTPPLAVRLRDFRVTGGTVVVDLLEDRYEARSLDVRLASAHLTGPGLDAPILQVAEAGAELLLPDTAGGSVVRDVTLADARIRIVDGATAFQIDRATFGSSRLANLEGVWDPALGGYGVDMTLTALDARVADLPWLPGEVPEGAAGSFQLRIEPRPGDRTLLALSEIDLRAPGSSATGSVRAVIGGARPLLEAIDLRVDPLSLDLVEAFTGPLPYGGTVTGTIRGTQADIRFDLRGRLTTPTITEPFVTDLTGQVALTEAGFELTNTQVTLDRVPLAALNAIAPGLPFSGPISGTVGLSGAPGEGPLRLDLRLEAGGGIVTINGFADVSGTVPSYDVEGRLIGVRLRSVLAPPVPPVEVHADFAVEGSGTDPRTATATVAANGTFTGWETEPGDTLVARATLANGTVTVRELSLEAGPVVLASAGTWNFVGGSGTIEYDLAVTDLAPLAPYLPADQTGQSRFARGRLRLAGTASGTLEEPHLEGEVTGEGFRWGEWAAQSFTGEYAVALLEGLPRVETDLVADELRTPFGDFEGVEGHIDFGRPTFQIAIAADQEGGRGVVEIEADGRIEEEGGREIFIRTMEVDLQQQRWRLPAPARIAWTMGDAVSVEGMELVQTDGDGRVVLDGIVAPVDDMDVTLDVAGLPVGDVLRLVGSDLVVTGELAVQGRVAGPASSPDLDVEVTLADGSFRGVAVRSVTSTVEYDQNRLVIDGTGLLGDSARLEIGGTLPARLQLAGSPILELIDDAPIDLRIVTRTFPLSTLDPGVTFAEAVEGRIEADLRVGGTPAEPRLSGSAQLLEGALTVPLLGRRFQNIQGEILLSGREATLQRLVVASGGTATLTGSLDFQELTNPSLELAAELQDFRLQDVEDETAAGFSGSVRLLGTVSEPVMTGSLLADDGAISLVPLQQPELSARLAGGGSDLLLPGSELDLGEAAEGGGIRIANLTFEAGDDLWLVTEEVRVRLAGTLTIDKTGTSTIVQGTLQGTGGTFELAAGPINRQFQIISSEIRFFGSPEPNPRLDIVASRVVRTPDGGNVDVRVQVSGTLLNPSMSLATATGAEIPESELLSFLIFGRPTSDLGQATGASQGVEGILGQGLAYTGLAEVLFSELNEEIDIFDYFRVDYLPGGGLYATAGVQLANDLFLSFDLPLGFDTDISAIGLEYEGDDLGVFRLAYEPVQSLDRLVGRRALSYLRDEINRQFALAWRKRWTY